MVYSKLIQDNPIRRWREKCDKLLTLLASLSRNLKRSLFILFSSVLTTNVSFCYVNYVAKENFETIFCCFKICISSHSFNINTHLAIRIKVRGSHKVNLIQTNFSTWTTTTFWLKLKKSSLCKIQLIFHENLYHYLFRFVHDLDLKNSSSKILKAWAYIY